MKGVKRKMKNLYGWRRSKAGKIYFGKLSEEETIKRRYSVRGKKTPKWAMKRLIKAGY